MRTTERLPAPRSRLRLALLSSGSLLIIGATASAQDVIPPGTTINAATPNSVGIDESSGFTTANGVTVNLAAANTTGVRATTGGVVTFDGSTGLTTSTTAAASAGHYGLRALGAGSTINATGSSLTVGPTSTTTTVSNLTGASAEGGAAVNLTNTPITMLGGLNSLSNFGLTSVGTDSQASYQGGTISTRSRASYGVLAQDGGFVSLGAGAQIATTGAGSASIAGSHALFATGASSLIEGAGIGLSVSGAWSSGARAENGGKIVLTDSSITSSGTSAADTDPPSAARVLSGGEIELTNVTITATGQRGNGFSVQDAGSKITVADSSITTSGNRAPAGFVFGGASATVTSSSLRAASPSVVLVQDAGSTISLTDTAIVNTGAPGYGLRALLGASATMTGGSSATEGRDSPALYASGGAQIIATNVTITTSGDDNAMGVVADGNGRITLAGGSVTTSGDAVRAASFPHGLTVRNPGAVLNSTDTTVVTTGLSAMGGVADDGGILSLDGNSITTQGFRSTGLLAITEQTGAQFPANLTTVGVTVETSGDFAHGIAAQARNDISVPRALASISGGAVTTHGDGAVGLRAVLANYGTTPITGRGEAVVVAADISVTTEGAAAHGALSRDNPTSVTMTDTTVETTGAGAHGAVAEAGGLIIGDGAMVTAEGADAFALFVVGEGGPVSTARFSNGSTLTNVSGPTIDVAGAGTITLSDTTVGGSGQWLKVGTVDDFAPLTSEPPMLGAVDPPPEPDPPDETPPEPVSAGTPVVLSPASLDDALLQPTALTAGLATLDISASTLTGSALTAAGSVSNVTLRDATVWNLTGSSNLTSLINNASQILFSAPTGDPTALSSYKTLTVVDYGGTGGTIAFNTYLGDDASPSDRLIIDGGTGSGDTAISVVRTAGGGAITRGDGILLVDDLTGQTTTADAFHLAAPVIAGPYEYFLQRGGNDPNDVSSTSDWFLRSTINCALPDAPSPPCADEDDDDIPPSPPPSPGPEPTPQPAPDPIPNFRPEASLYTAIPAMERLYGLALIDTLHMRMGEEEQLRHFGSLNDEEGVDGAWTRLIGWTGEHDGDGRGVYGPDGPAFDWDLYGLQLGLELYRNRDPADDPEVDDDEAERHHAGVTFAIARMDGEVEHYTGRVAGQNAVDAYSLGGYWTKFGDKGGYLDAVLQATWYDYNVQSSRLPEFSDDGFGAALSVEIGKPLDLEDDQELLERGWIIEPQGQLIYQVFDEQGVEDAAAQVAFQDTESLLGRLGLRFANTWNVWEGRADEPRMGTIWGRFNVWRELMGPPKTVFSSEDGPVPFIADIGDQWFEVNGGATAQLSNSATAYLDVGYLWDSGERGDALHGRVGARWNW